MLPLVGDLRIAGYNTADDSIAIQLGPVKGTLLVQLASFVQAAPPEFASWASPKKSAKNAGFYKFLNTIMKREGGQVDNMSAEECRLLCIETCEMLGGDGGRKIDFALLFLDQNACRLARMLYSGTGNDGRKIDHLFFHQRENPEVEEMVFLPIEAKVGERIANLGIGLTTREIRFFILERWYGLQDYMAPLPSQCTQEALEGLAVYAEGWSGVGLQEHRRCILYDDQNQIDHFTLPSGIFVVYEC